MAKKNFSSAVDAAVIDTASDPMANLLGSTSDYLAPDELVTPRPIASTSSVLSGQSFGDGEEVAISAEQILQREKQLSAGDKGFKGTGAEIVSTPSPTLPSSMDEPLANNDQGFSEEVTEERKERRRAVIAKFSAKFINNIVAGASVAAHSYFVAPDESVMERHTALMNRVASLSPTEIEELQRLDRIIKRYGEMEANFAEQAKLDEEDNKELQDCIQDITSTEDVNLHPGWLILIIVGIQLITNAITIFTNRVSVRK
jgi:hypothetical protein